MVCYILALEVIILKERLYKSPKWPNVHTQNKKKLTIKVKSLAMKSSSCSCFSPATAVLAVLLLVTWKTAEAAGRKVPAIFVFGDSTVDVGNNNYLPGNASTKANFQYNGIDFPNGVPTGRFCNGYIGIDFLAQKLGFSQSPPAVLSHPYSNEDIVGANYASGGSGVFNTTNEGVSLSNELQIRLFEISVGVLTALRGANGRRRILSKSLFVFSTANNDFFVHLARTGLQDQTQNQLFISSLTSQFKQQLTKVYNLGGRKFAIYGTGILGCVPRLRALSSTFACVQPLNLLSLIYNNATRDMLLELQSTLPGFRYSFAKSFEITQAIAANATRYGFKELVSACCGNGTLNAESFCTPGANYCSNRNEHYSWDYVHPTEAAYRVNNELVYNGGRDFTFPINFRQLASL